MFVYQHVQCWKSKKCLHISLSYNNTDAGIHSLAGDLPCCGVERMVEAIAGFPGKRWFEFSTCTGRR